MATLEAMLCSSFGYFLILVSNGGAIAPVVTFLIVPGRYIGCTVRRALDHVILRVAELHPSSASRNVERDPPFSARCRRVS